MLPIGACRKPNDVNHIHTPNQLASGVGVEHRVPNARRGCKLLARLSPNSGEARRRKRNQTTPHVRGDLA